MNGSLRQAPAECSSKSSANVKNDLKRYLLRSYDFVVVLCANTFFAEKAEMPTRR